MRPVDPERPGTIFEWNVDPDWINRDIEEYGAPSPAERAARERVRDVTC